MTQIERSPGLLVTVGAIPYIVGGGYHGDTDALDQVVDKAAEALRDMFDHPVTIRFNSDRQSGGAWLKTSEVDGIGANCEIQIGASRHDLEEIRERLARNKAKWGWDDNFEEICQRLGIDPNGPNEQIRIVSYIKADYLRDLSIANDGEGKDLKSYIRHETLEAAIAFVRENAVADPRPVTAMRKRRAAASKAATTRKIRRELDGLDKKTLAAIMWHVPYQVRPKHYSFWTPKESKAVLRECIVLAVRQFGYRLDPKHMQARERHR